MVTWRSRSLKAIVPVSTREGNSLLNDELYAYNRIQSCNTWNRDRCYASHYPTCDPLIFLSKRYSRNGWQGLKTELPRWLKSSRKFCFATWITSGGPTGIETAKIPIRKLLCLKALGEDYFKNIVSVSNFSEVSQPELYLHNHLSILHPARKNRTFMSIPVQKDSWRQSAMESCCVDRTVLTY